MLALGVFDQDVDEELSVKYPILYLPGQQGALFNRKEFLFSVMHGIISSLILFFIPYGTMYLSVNDQGKDAADLQSFGFAVATILVIVVNLQVNTFINRIDKGFKANIIICLITVWLGHIVLDWLQPLLHLGNLDCSLPVPLRSLQRVHLQTLRHRLGLHRYLAGCMLNGNLLVHGAAHICHPSPAHHRLSIRAPRRLPNHGRQSAHCPEVRHQVAQVQVEYIQDATSPVNESEHTVHETVSVCILA